MAQYTINELESLSGIKAHTIRIWEQRYNILIPSRSSTNIRYYDDDQLKRLLNISILVNNGFKISSVSKLSDSEIATQIKTIADQEISVEASANTFVNNLITSSLDYNEPLFEKAFSGALLRFGLYETYIKVIYPVLVKLGVLWGTEVITPAQEHFISNLIKQKLFTAIDGLLVPTRSRNTWVLFLPEQEDHEIGLLLANFILRLNRCKVIYLGQRLPYKNLSSVVEQINPTHLLFFLVTHQETESINKLLSQMNKDFKQCEMILACSPKIKDKLKLPARISWMRSPEELHHYYRRH
jgi:DNA-binding transcriptional MerR regulator